MSDYISREAAIEAITEEQCYKCPVKPGTCYICKTSSAKRQIRRIPAADVRPVVRGSWEWEMYQMTPHCSVCGGKGKPGPAIEERFLFCPWCGADMREDNIRSISKIHEQLKGVQEK